MSTRPEPDSDRERGTSGPVASRVPPEHSAPPHPPSTGEQYPPPNPHRYSQPDPPRSDADQTTTPATGLDRRAVLGAQRDRHGGIKWGSAFFGWLTATGTALLLTALAAVAGTAFGLAGAPVDAGQAADPTAGIVSAVVVLVILFLAYFCGGYVAGRMARFSGAKQGFAVWVWAVLIAIVVAVLTTIAGSRFDVLATLDGLPRLPINEGTLTTGGITAAVVALVAGLGGAVLGGLAGMRFHRKVDRAGFDRP